jgi:predicted O-methyltransferase YrrM
MTAKPAPVRVPDGRPALRPAPAWVRGATPTGDAEFLIEMVAAHAPGTIVEIGVAAGVSSAVLLYALDGLPDAADRRVLRSCDIHPACYFDAARATGEAVRIMYPRPRARWILDTDADARRLSQTLAPASVDLTFIDANHYHPWPLLDLLHMTALARPGSWVILHDIDLSAIAPAFAAWGATWLFDGWPFEKVAGRGSARNIGAVRLPADLTRLIPFAAGLIERTWEFAPTLWHVALPAPFTPIQERVRARIEGGGRRS